MNGAKLESLFKDSDLTAKESHVLKLRLGLEYGPSTLEDISKIFEITRERVRQIEFEALRRLRHGQSQKYKDIRNRLKDYL